MPLEFEGDLFGGDRGKTMKGILKRPRKNAAKLKPKKKKPAAVPVAEPLLSPAPYKQRIEDLLLATGWKLGDEDFGEKWGYSRDTVSRQIKGTFKANVLFVRRLVRLEAMYEKELACVHSGVIRMVKLKGKNRWMRWDSRSIKGVVEDSKRGL